MKKFLSVLLLGLGLSACTNVPSGFVGVKVYKLGGEKGVDHEVVGVGRYWLSWNEELFLFPVFQQNYVWTKEPTEGSPNDESITFQDKDGLEINADFGISYSIEPTKVGTIFQKYRRGVTEITDVFLRNHVRDAVNNLASNLRAEELYGSGKTVFVDKVQELVTKEVEPLGIKIDKIYLIGSFRLPTNVLAALNAKIEATQKAQQRENEVAETRAMAEKEKAKAIGDAAAILTRAEAEAKANRVVANSLSSSLIEYEKAKKWDGKLPSVMGTSSGILMNLNNK